MIEYTELTNDIVGKLEIDNTDTDRFDVDENLAIAQLSLLNTLPFHFINNAIKTVKGNLSNGVNSYQWPSDYVRFNRMWVDFANSITGSNEGKKVQIYNDIDNRIPVIGSVATKNYPFIDLNVEGGFGIYPVPDADVTYGWRCRYVWQVPNPTSSQDCLLQYNLKNLLVYRTVQLCALIQTESGNPYNLGLSQEMKDLFTTELMNFLPKQGAK